MKKVLVLVMLLYALALSGCGNAIESNSWTILNGEKLAEAETRASAAENNVAELEGKIRDLDEKLIAAEIRAVAAEDELVLANSGSPSDPVSHTKNIIVKNPKRNCVTYEIDEKLVGRYYVESDPEMYFEIKSDATVEISLNALSGYAKVDSEHIRLTIYYSDQRVIINFNLVSGNWTFPARCGLSVGFEGDLNYTSFLSTVYWAEDNLKFVRQPL